MSSEGRWPAVSWPALIFRWAFGIALVSWRYLWQTTPLHRSESVDTTDRPPPAIPEEVDDEGLQRIEDGVGAMFHRRFSVEIADAGLDAVALMGAVVNNFWWHVPREIVHVRQEDSMGRALRRNDDFVVDMPGPWNGPVRVVLVDSTRLRLATRNGHLEAGQIEFSAHDGDRCVVFEIDAWARPSSRSAHLLYSRMRLAKEIQLNMWVRFCKAAVTTAGGRMTDGIRIVTHCVPAPAEEP